MRKIDSRYVLLGVCLVGGLWAYASRANTLFKGPPPFEFVCMDKRGIPTRDWTNINEAIGQQGKRWQLTTATGERIIINSNRNERCTAFLDEAKYRRSRK